MIYWKDKGFKKNHRRESILTKFGRISTTTISPTLESLIHIGFLEKWIQIYTMFCTELQSQLILDRNNNPREINEINGSLIHIGFLEKWIHIYTLFCTELQRWLILDRNNNPREINEINRSSDRFLFGNNLMMYLPWNSCSMIFMDWFSQ